MKFVVDTNIVFSAILNTQSKIGDLIMNSHGIFEFYACDTLGPELKRHRTKLLELSKLSLQSVKIKTIQLEDQIFFKSYTNSSVIPSDEILITEFQKKNPHCEVEKIKILKHDNSVLVYQEREQLPIKIDSNFNNCFRVVEGVETTFIHGAKNGSKPGFCKISIKPYSEISSILVSNNFTNGEKYKQSISRFEENAEYQKTLRWEEIRYFQYLAEVIIKFCNEYKIVETQFAIEDLNHHVIDTSPSKYGYYLEKKLVELFEDNQFEKVKTA